MKKEEIVSRYGEAEYARQLEQQQAYREEHKEAKNARAKKYREEHPEEVIANHQEEGRKGGKYYAKHLKDNRTGLQGARNKIRFRHRCEFKEIKDTLAEEVELHHEWIGDTAEYRGMAFVEKKAHRDGFIDVILLLDGEIIPGYEQ